MNDPYSVLGLSPNATDDEVKKAYRDLARKYHPDNYHDNPLADLAQEKMKEINEAYDAITRGRSGGSSYQGSAGGSYSGSSQQRGSYSSYGPFGGGAGPYGAYGAYGGARPGPYAAVRMAINMGDLNRAEQLLNSSGQRDAEWKYLLGKVCYKRGWTDEARNYYQRACSMEPSNLEFRNELEFMESGGVAYRPQGFIRNSRIDACDICTCMLCANMCCN